MRTNQRPNRRGAALAAALTLLLVVMLIAGAMLQQLAATQRGARLVGRKLQAQWLAESALDRALVKLQSDRQYHGETWQPPTDESSTIERGSAHIEVKQPTDDAGFLISVTADFPDHPQQRARVQMSRRFRLPAASE
jgi:type II secretory pathway component PulK